MSRRSSTALLLAAVALTTATASPAAPTHESAAPALGAYKGRAGPDASGKPRAIAFAVKQEPCASGGKPGSCLLVDGRSFVQAKCASSGLMYDAFFPVTAPIAIPASGSIHRVFTLYASSSGVSAARTPGAVASGQFRLDLRFGPDGDATGSERFRVDFRDGDGLCDSGTVGISASRA